MWYVQGGMVAVCTVGLGTRNSEFLSVVRSMADGLREACGTLWMSIPTQTGFSHYSAMTLSLFDLTVDVRQVQYTILGSIIESHCACPNSYD